MSMNLGLLCGGYAPVFCNLPGKFLFTLFYQLARTSTLFKRDPCIPIVLRFTCSATAIHCRTAASLLCVCLSFKIPYLLAYISRDICWQLWFIGFPWCTYACGWLAFELNVSCFYCELYFRLHWHLSQTPGVLLQASLLSFRWPCRQAGLLKLWHIVDVPVGSDVAWRKKQLSGPLLWWADSRQC